MRVLSRTIVTLVLVAFVAAAASGAQVSQVEEFSGTPDFSRTLTFNKFDLGPDCTLNWIKVILTGNCEGGQLILDNDSEETATGTFEFGCVNSIGSSSVPMLDATMNPVVGQIKVVYSDGFELAPNQGDGLGDYDPSAPDGMIYIGELVSTSNSGFINSMFFNDYIGSGTFTVQVDTGQYMNYGGISGIEVAFTPVEAFGTMEIIYDYTCVPEPTSILVLATGMGSLLALRRRRA